MRKKLSIGEVKDRLKHINTNIIILDDIYISAKTKMKCKCLIDGHIWECNWNNLQQGGGCPKCANNIKFTIEEIKGKLAEINPNIEILTTTYKNNHSKLKCKCKNDDHVWFTKWNHLQQGIGCPMCAITSNANMCRLSMEEIKNRLLKFNPNIEILSDNYINARELILCRCKIDGYEWKATWSNLKKGSGCPECAYANRRGSKSSSWKGGITPLYNHLRNHVIAEWKRDSMKACNYKCVVTGERFDVIHHLVSYNTILQETLDVVGLPLFEEVNDYNEEQLTLLKNTCLQLHYKYGLGVCLTNDIHKEFHDIYGYGDNTPEQFEEFKRMKEFSKTS